MENNPTNENVMEHNRAKIYFTREGGSTHENQMAWRNGITNFERDCSKLWNLTTVLNEEVSSRNKTVLHVNNQLLTETTAAN